MVDEKEILKQAKGIMDDFMKALEKVKVKDSSFGAEREVNIREPSKSDYNEEFKRDVLSNAPKKDSDFIIAEKKNW